MRTAFLATLLTLFSFGSAAPVTPLKADGRMWETFGNSGSQGMSIKAAYVQGAIEGLRAGAARGYTRGRMDEKKNSANTANNDWNEVTASMEKVADEYLPQHTSILDIVHQMDKFYGDYKNTPVCMVVAVQESVSSLKGNASTEQGLELDRMGCQ